MAPTPRGSAKVTGVSESPRYSVVLQAPAKLTLNLEITGVRTDGLHLIRAEMVTVDFFDTIELAPGGTGFEVVGGGSDISVGPDNLVAKALALAGRSAAVRLTKRIPSQAGLGGGSSDAGAILRWARTLTDLAVPPLSWAPMSPFCTVGGRAMVRRIWGEG